MTKLLTVLTVSAFCCFLNSCAEKKVEKKDQNTEKEDAPKASGG